MAMIACSECSKQISDKAKSCPNCGFPMSDLQPIQPFVPPEPIKIIPLSQEEVNKMLSNSDNNFEYLTAEELGYESEEKYTAAIDSVIAEHLRESRDIVSPAEPDKLLSKLIRQEQLAHVLTPAILKAVVGGIVIYLWDAPGIIYYLFIFMFIYWLTSIFVFSLKLTRNYIIGAILGVALMMGSGYFLDRINIFEFDSIGTDILATVFFSIPLFFDIIRIVIALKK